MPGLADIAAVIALLGSLLAALITFRSAQRSAARAEEETRASFASTFNKIRESAVRVASIQIEADQASASTETEDTQDRVVRLVRSLHESQRLITELQVEIDAKAAAVERLQAEEEHSRQLAALREKEAAAVNELIHTTLTTAHDELRRQLEDERHDLRKNIKFLQNKLTAMQRSGRRDQWLFFGAGVLLSIPVGIVINIVF